MTVLELITFPSAESYQKDPVTALSPFASILAGAEDINPSSTYLYHGLRVEDKAIGQAVIPWTSAEAFRSFVTGPSGKDIKSTFGQAVDPDKISQVSLKLFEFTEPLSILGPMLTAPITEYALMVAKSEEVAEEAGKALSKFASAVEGAPGIHGITFGKQIGEEVIFIVVVGWDSVQAHQDALANEASKEVMNQLSETLNPPDLFHIAHLRI